MPGFAFDIYEVTIMRLVTPLPIKEWGIAAATVNLPVLSSLRTYQSRSRLRMKTRS
jgi:hypothetical protein